MIALDCETTGVDLYHGALPFFVTVCDAQGAQRWWEWDVDPLTRRVAVPPADWAEIAEVILENNLVLQNAKFDVAALNAIFSDDGSPLGWPWYRTYDTLIAGHLLYSNQPHDLTSMALQYLGVDISPHEQRLKEAVQECRRLAKKEFPEWRIAQAGLPEMPSAKESTWRYDYWLPRALAKELGLSPAHEWWGVLSEYANADSAVTAALWPVMEKEIKARWLWEVYLERLKVLPIAWGMERRGITVNGAELARLETEYKCESAKAAQVCHGIAAAVEYDLELPKAGANGSLRTFVFDVLELPKRYSKKSKTAEPTLDKSAIDWYETELEPGDGLDFIKALKTKRKRDTALAYMDGYRRYWQPGREKGWYVLHPSLNPTGTDTLRWSSNNPNEQNISKQKGFNLRSCFGPAPGREWWSLDAQNIELRIPAFEAGEKELMDVFLHPEKPPYYGSYHLVVFDVLHPALFAAHGKECKTLFEDTWYQWVKNGNFATIYGAQGDTADAAYHVPGAHAKLRSRFPKIAALADRQITYAEQMGYVETIPDKEVCPERGYPLLCTRSEYGRILPTVPLNYHIQGTACWWMMRAMIKCEAKLTEWRAQGFDGFMAIQVHDELVFDFPKSARPLEKQKGLFRLKDDTLWRVKTLAKLMESCGNGIGVPTPVSVEYHARNWAEGVTV